MPHKPPQQDLPSQLYEWALDEMHFRPQGRHINTRIPDVEDFRSICRGQMVDIWKFVIGRVHSAQTVKKVQGNLALKNRQTSSLAYKVKYRSGEKFSQQRAELHEKKRHLAAELAGTVADIGHIERDLERLQRELAATEQSYQNMASAVKDYESREGLLNVHSGRCSETTSQYEEYSRRIQDKTQRYTQLLSKTGNETKYYSKVGADAQNATSAALESACTRDTRESCQTVGSFLHQLLQGSFSADKTVVHHRKEQLWSSVEAVMADYPANQILHSLVATTQDSALNLRDKTSKIDIKKDAEALRFKYERGHLQDISRQPSALQSVHQLLEESQTTHIRKFVETEKHKNQAWKMQQRLGTARKQIHETLRRFMKGDEGALELARGLLELELEEAAMRRSLHVLGETTQQLKLRNQQASREREVLYAKHQNIQDFRTLADGKQNLIRVLVRQNSNARSRLEEQQLQILQYIQASLCGHEAHCKGSSLQLQNGVAKEVDVFAGLSLPYLMFTVLESAFKVAVIDLSINRLKATPTNAGSSVIQQVIQALEFPSFKAPECLLQQAIDLRNEADDITGILKAQEAFAQKLEGRDSDTASTVEHIAGLCDEVEQHDRKQLEKVLPMLQERLLQATKALTDCLHVKDTVQYWWEQPAQYTTPWVQLDELTLQQWRDKWVVAVTRLRQLQVSQQQ